MAEQKYKSATTSIKKKVPFLSRILQEYYASEGDVVLDYGGGKYDTATDFLKEFGITNVIYDPYNREPEENAQALAKDDYDFVVLSDVLNVVAEKQIRKEIIQDAWRHLREGGILLVKIYEGDGSLIIKVNEKRNSCQLNQDTYFYFWEIRDEHLFRNIKLLTKDGKKIIEAIK